MTSSRPSGNVLITSIGRRAYLAEYFRDALHGTAHIVGVDADPTAPALAVCDRACTVPRIADPNYIDALMGVIRREGVTLVFSVNDHELMLLAEHRDHIESATGATLYVPDVASARVCADKWATFEFATSLGIPTPRTYQTVDGAIDALHSGEVALPLIVKPRWGSGSLGVMRIERAEDLSIEVERCSAAVWSVAGGVLGSGGSVLIQECMLGREYGVDVAFSRDGRLLGYAAKQKISMRAGETDKAVTVEADRFSLPVATLVAHLRHRGNLDCDFIEHNGRLHLLEMNPRFGGGYPFTHEAGANHVQMLLDDFNGVPQSGYTYTIGAKYAKSDRLLRVG